MGSSRLIFEEERSKVEYTPLTIFFEKVCPMYMSYGMSYHDFWYGEAFMVNFYREANKLKIKQQDENNWMIGMYVYEALCDVSPVLHAFSKKETKPLPYPDKPFLFDKLETNVKSTKQLEEEKEQEVENERLKFIVQMNNWFRATKKQFDKK